MEALMEASSWNWLLIVVLILLVLGLIRGIRLGFLRVIFSLIAGIVLIVVVSIATPYVGQFIADHSILDDNLTVEISSHLQSQAGSALTGDASGAEGLAALGLAIPALLQDQLMGGDANLVSDLLSGTGIFDTIGNKLAMMCINGLAFVILLIIGGIVIAIIGRLLKKVNKVPVLGKINRAFGAVAGVFQALLVIWFFFAVIAFLNAAGTGAGIAAMIQNNWFLSLLYEKNLILAILSALL